jgi:hypothetical protein
MGFRVMPNRRDTDLTVIAKEWDPVKRDEVRRGNFNMLKPVDIVRLKVLGVLTGRDGEMVRRAI